MMLYRKKYRELLEWKNDHKNTCLMVKGARQVGKTYLIREFGKAEYESFIEINFIKQNELKSIFEQSLDSENIYKAMTMFIPGIRLIPGKTLIFLDEIQSCGNARTALKFLAESGLYDVIASGSLLGLSYGEDGGDDVEEPQSIPVGYEDQMMLYSLDFEEFLIADGYGNAVSVMRDYYVNKKEIPQAFNEKFTRIWREYMVVGGMPEVVASYVSDHDFAKVEAIQNKIINDYREDIAKHSKGAEKIKVRKCYDSVPKQLAKELKKFQYSVVEKGQTSKKYGGSVQWLKDSNIVNLCYNVKEPYIPLIANDIEEQFKMYLNDTGLLTAMYGHETKVAIIKNNLVGNAKGGIYENIISETLVKNGYSLHYYKPSDSIELEFIIEKDGCVVPLEVKAGNTATVSLNSFIKKYHPVVAYKLINGNVGVVDEKFTMPHYLTMFI